jgi:hypothetical protein
MMHEILITSRADDIHASVVGQTGVWGCGKTESAALGDLIRTHRKLFNIGKITNNVTESKRERPKR